MRLIKSVTIIGMVLSMAWLCSCGKLSGQLRNLREWHTIVADGKAQVVIVTATNPAPVAAYAAQELVYHLEKAAGVKLQIVTEQTIPQESAARIYVGDCQAARTEGINVKTLSGEGCVLKTKGNALFIVGQDGNGAPLSDQTPAGTLWGVYELLERTTGVRWLWPGELGTYVPKTNNITISNLNETIQPRLLVRGIRPGGPSGVAGKACGFTPDGASQYFRDQAVFLRRHRISYVSQLGGGGHAFEKWWDLYGKEHPDWFQLVDGKRGGRSMCVSNPGFHNQIVNLWLEKCRKSPGEVVNCCENDSKGLCSCSNCLAWDGPQPDGMPSFFDPDWFGPHVVSDRYARFYLAVQQLAARHDPGATVVAYAYVNYFPSPSPEIKLNEHIIISTVPDCFFPRTDQEQQWVKNQWAGWRHTGCRLHLRPNYMLEGYCMPHVFAHQFADEFQYEFANGMEGTDFDSLTGQWAVQGTTLYLLMRLPNRPDTPADKLLEEYYSGFGPAARHVKAYFDYWEKYTNDNRDRFREIAKRRSAEWITYAMFAHECFPPSSFEAGGKLLEQAEAVVGKGSEYAARVEFLRKGLEHAKLTAIACDSQAGGESSLAGALDELSSFRRKIEQDNISNLDFCKFIENRSWPIVPDVKVTEENSQALADRWHCMTDPEQHGRQNRWFAPDFDDHAWREVSISSPLEKQGIHDYVYAWYRLTVEIPERRKGQRITLRLGAVDETCWVWVNGKPVGEFIYNPLLDPGSWQKPLIFDITAAAAAGQRNQITVLVQNKSGAGGIWKPSQLIFK